MTNSLAKLLKIIAAALLILFGLVGHLVPLLPGGIFIAAGILLLADAIPKVQQYIAHIERKYPSIEKGLRRVRRADGSLNLTRVATALIVISLLFGAFAYFTFPLLQQINWP